MLNGYANVAHLYDLHPGQDPGENPIPVAADGHHRSYLREFGQHGWRTYIAGMDDQFDLSRTQTRDQIGMECADAIGDMRVSDYANTTDGVQVLGRRWYRCQERTLILDRVI